MDPYVYIYTDRVNIHIYIDIECIYICNTTISTRDLVYEVGQNLCHAQYPLSGLGKLCVLSYRQIVEGMYPTLQTRFRDCSKALERGAVASREFSWRDILPTEEE